MTDTVHRGMLIVKSLLRDLCSAYIGPYKLHWSQVVGFLRYSHILVPLCSVHFALHYGKVQFTIAYTVTELCESKYSSGQNKVNVRPACNDCATVIQLLFRARLLCVLETFLNCSIY